LALLTLTVLLLPGLLPAALLLLTGLLLPATLLLTALLAGVLVGILILAHSISFQRWSSGAPRPNA
jgi:hypothetical protein